MKKLKTSPLKPVYHALVREFPQLRHVLDAHGLYTKFVGRNNSWYVSITKQGAIYHTTRNGIPMYHGKDPSEAHKRVARFLRLEAFTAEEAYAMIEGKQVRRLHHPKSEYADAMHQIMGPMGPHW